MRRATLWCVIGMLALSGGGCSAGNDAAPARTTPPAAVGPLRPSEPFGLTSATLQSPDGGVALAIPVYDAATPKARARGLMHRKRLPARAGMIFRFPRKHRGGFYMKNTLIPLSIAFFDATGTVVGVFDMPPCKADPCPTYGPEGAYAGALEVNRGFFGKLGLERGWRVHLPPGLPEPS